MSGHSKWSTIKHKKEAKDAKRGKLFTKLLKEISISVKMGGKDPSANPRLRMAIQNAKGANLPKDNITRAIKKASGADGTVYQETTYEGYGINGVGVFIECQTDNINRTVAAVRNIFTKSGGSLGKKGTLEFIFDRKGVFYFERPQNKSLDDLELELIDTGAEEIEEIGKEIIVIVDMNNFYTMQVKLESLNIEIKSSNLERIPKTTVELNENDQFKILKMIDKLEDCEDVQKIYHNMTINEE